MAELTKQLFELLHSEVVDEAYRISERMDHSNWFPCGNDHIHAKGNSPLVRALKKARPNGWRFSPDTYAGGYWISVNLPMRDAFEGQSRNFSRPCYEYLAKRLNELGCQDLFVEGYDD